MKRITGIYLSVLAGWLIASPADSPTASIEAVGARGAVYTNRQAPEFKQKKTRSAEQWELKNWKQETVASGTWRKSGVFKLAPLPCGYYYLNLLPANPADKNIVYPFAVVKDRSERIINPDSVYAVDSAISWCAAADKQNPFAQKPQFELVADLIALGGFSWARDRYSWRWTVCRSAPGKLFAKQYDESGELLKKRGIRRLNVFHDSPEWTRKKNGKLPEDLMELYRFTKKLAEQKNVDAWEFWNEADIGFSNEPVWVFAAAQKAAYLGFKAGRPDLPVLLGSLCGNPPGAYAETLMKNGVAGYFDIFNYHTYTGLKTMPFLLRDLHALLKRHGVNGTAIWFTENGTQAEGPAKNDSVRPGKKAHSPEQEMTVAEFIPKANILLQSLGVSRIFSFQLCPFNEQGGNKDWGLLRRDFTAKPGFAALSVLNDKLGDTRILGELKAPRGGRGFLFQDRSGFRQTAVFWKQSRQIDQVPSEISGIEFTFPASGTLIVTDHFGNERIVKAENSITLPAERFVTYVSGLSGLKPSMPAYPAGKREDKAANIDQTIVLVPRIPAEFKLSRSKDSVDPGSDGTHEMKLEIWNFSDKSKTGTLNVSPPNSIDGLPTKTTVPPFGKTVYSLTLHLQKSPVLTLEIGGSFNGKAISRSTVNFHRPEKILEKAQFFPISRMLEQENWRPISSGGMTIHHDDTEKAVRFDALFPASVQDRWLYPEFALQLPQETLANTDGLQFEIRALQGSKIKYSNFFAVQEDRPVQISFPKPTDQWETRTIFFDQRIRPEMIRALQFGLNTDTDKTGFLLRNIRAFSYR